MTTYELLGIWAATGMTLAVFSFLYRDNPFYRISEHIFIGISMGYMVVRTFFDMIVPDLYEPLFTRKHPDYVLIIPAVLGILFFSRFVKRISWLGRYSFGFMVGIASGMAIPRFIAANVLQQAEGTIVPLFTGDTTLEIISEILVLIGVVTVLFYFFFSIEHKGVVAKTASRIGVCFLMIAFGAAFGYTVMARVSLFIERCVELKTYTTGDFGFATLVLLVVVVSGLVIYSLLYPDKGAREQAS